jgi:hypothetical protein
MLLAVYVAEPPEERGRHGGAEQVAREDPGGPALGGVQLVLDRRQRRRDQRLEQREREAGEGQHGQRDVGVLSVVLLRHARGAECPFRKPAWLR